MASAGLTRSGSETSQHSTPQGQPSRARLIASERTKAHGRDRKTCIAYPTAAGCHCGYRCHFLHEHYIIPEDNSTGL